MRICSKTSVLILALLLSGTVAFSQSNAERKANVSEVKKIIKKEIDYLNSSKDFMINNINKIKTTDRQNVFAQLNTIDLIWDSLNKIHDEIDKDPKSVPSRYFITNSPKDLGQFVDAGGYRNGNQIRIYYLENEDAYIHCFPSSDGTRYICEKTDVAKMNELLVKINGLYFFKK